MQIPTELIDPIFGNIQNSIVQGYLLRKPVFNEENPTKIEDMQLIPMDKNQVHIFIVVNGMIIKH